MNDAVIQIKNLRLRTYIGFNPEELEKQQDVIVNADIHYPAAQAADSDNVEKALDYKVMTKEIIKHTEQGSFKLLERLTADILSIVMLDEKVTYAQVRVDKPHALRFADSVSLTLSAHR
ncbi:MAG: dihydroneopterin triphosphate 2'-epimerase [Pseudomonadales bacterium]|nr:dihydroneopterin triphosphate 2'-epimerase [Pseudomonadales bacterium]